MQLYHNYYGVKNNEQSRYHLLSIFICGVQVGIRHGKELQRQEYYDYIIQN